MICRENEIMKLLIKKLNRKKAHELIMAMARSTKEGAFFTTDAKVKRCFGSDDNFNRIVEECRDFSKSVPKFENLAGSTWETNVDGDSYVKVFDRKTGETITSLHRPGIISLYSYQYLFEHSVSELNESIKQKSYNKLLDSITNGIASIEAFIRFQADIYNRSHPDNQLIDNKANKVSFDDKIDCWIPQMTGCRVDKSQQNWNNFKILMNIRDNEHIHRKKFAVGIEIDKLVKFINLFPNGIAGFLFDLHVVFKWRIPSKIVRYKFFPGLEVVE